MKEILFISSLIMLSWIPVYFVYNKVYRDGLVGRICLLSISFFSIVIVLDILLSEGSVDKYYPQNIIVSLLTAFAIFLVWHLWRFHTRVLRKGKCPPNCPVDRRKNAERRFVVN